MGQKDIEGMPTEAAIKAGVEVVSLTIDKITGERKIKVKGQFACKSGAHIGNETTLSLSGISEDAYERLLAELQQQELCADSPLVLSLSTPLGSLITNWTKEIDGLGKGVKVEE